MRSELECVEGRPSSEQQRTMCGTHRLQSVVIVWRVPRQHFVRRTLSSCSSHSRQTSFDILTRRGNMFAGARRLLGGLYLGLGCHWSFRVSCSGRAGAGQVSRAKAPPPPPAAPGKQHQHPSRRRTADACNTTPTRRHGLGGCAPAPSSAAGQRRLSDVCARCSF